MLYCGNDYCVITGWNGSLLTCRSWCPRWSLVFDVFSNLTLNLFHESSYLTVDMSRDERKATLNPNNSRKLSNEFWTSVWCSEATTEKLSTHKPKFKTPATASIHAAGVSLRKTRNPCWLQGRCCVAHPDLWPQPWRISLRGSIKYDFMIQASNFNSTDRHVWCFANRSVR